MLSFTSTLLIMLTIFYVVHNLILLRSHPLDTPLAGYSDIVRQPTVLNFPQNLSSPLHFQRVAARRTAAESFFWDGDFDSSDVYMHDNACWRTQFEFSETTVLSFIQKRHLAIADYSHHLYRRRRRRQCSMTTDNWEGKVAKKVADSDVYHYNHCSPPVAEPCWRRPVEVDRSDSVRFP